MIMIPVFIVKVVRSQDRKRERTLPKNQLRISLLHRMHDSREYAGFLAAFANNQMLNVDSLQ